MSECYELVVGCKRDSNGYYWITGRTDDCMNVSGHLLSTAQIESALVEHDAVTEAAVVSFETSCLFLKQSLRSQYTICTDDFPLYK